MAHRVAGSLALIAFALCLLMGIQAQNGFTTTVGRAMLAMAGTYVIGLTVGWMGQKMLQENLEAETRKMRDSAQKTESADR